MGRRKKIRDSELKPEEKEEKERNIIGAQAGFSPKPQNWAVLFCSKALLECHLILQGTVLVNPQLFKGVKRTIGNGELNGDLGLSPTRAQTFP